jgi:Fe2+ or Zn2+ uptake regulation protein
MSRRKSPCGRPAQNKVSQNSPRELERWHDQLRSFLEQKQLKHSEQRWKIVKLILSTSGHFTTQEIVQRVRRAHPDIGAATVYRNISLLCDAHILKETLINPEGHAVYELYDEDQPSRSFRVYGLRPYF